MDIDIDFPDRDIILSKIKHRAASIDSSTKHKTGIYVTEIPHNPVSNMSTINYKDAEARDYFKLDFLNVSIYNGVRDEQHLMELIDTEPMWELLESDEFVDQIFHINGHGYLMRKLRPNSLEKLAACLAIIRPAKKYLSDSSWEVIDREVWIKPQDGEYYFKKSHAFSYAMAVVVHINLTVENLLNQASL